MLDPGLKAIRPADLAAALAPAAAPPGIWHRVESRTHPSALSLHGPIAAALALAAVVIVSVIGWYPGPRSLGRLAVAAHENLSGHPERLACNTPDPAQLGLWLRDQAGIEVGFAPAPDVEIAGGRLIEPGVAAVHYRVAGKPATLVISRHGTAGNNASKQSAVEGVFSWTSRGNAYALAAGSRDACRLCHAVI